ncbi:MAG: carbohydrate ABC transporter permease [Actinobacteria bacterium]|nr:carbohydrate ABC transporter permease [Actinomycetota bacterium]
MINEPISLKKTKKYSFLKFINYSSMYIFLAIAVIVSLGPFTEILRLSFKDTMFLIGSEDIKYSLINYINLLTKTNFLRWTLNTIIYAFSVVVIKVILDTLTGYIFAKFNFPGKNFIFLGVLGTIMIPFAVLIYPSYVIITKLGLINTYPGLIIPMLANPFGIFLMRQFISSIPNDIIESARIDGCTELGIFFKIIIPLSRPGQTVLAIITFVWQWTNLIWPLVVTNKDQMRTLPLGLATIPTEYIVDWGIMAAGALLSIAPILIFFLIYQKGFIEGMTSGAVKG